MQNDNRVVFAMLFSVYKIPKQKFEKVKSI